MIKHELESLSRIGYSAIERSNPAILELVLDAIAEISSALVKHRDIVLSAKSSVLLLGKIETIARLAVKRHDRLMLFNTCETLYKLFDDCARSYFLAYSSMRLGFYELISSLGEASIDNGFSDGVHIVLECWGKIVKKVLSLRKIGKLTEMDGLDIFLLMAPSIMISKSEKEGKPLMAKKLQIEIKKYFI